MAIFQLFKMEAAAILDFSNFKFLTVRRLKSWNCIDVQNLVEIGLQNLVEIGQTSAEI